MATQATASTLEKAGLKVTGTRKRILEVFQAHEHALNYNEIQDELNGALDKVTVYRNLKTFEETGIIHQVPDMSGSVRYALCSSACSEHNHHHDSHLHFKCDACQKTFCLEESTIPHLPLPNGYLASNVNVLINGLCQDCYQKK